MIILYVTLPCPLVGVPPTWSPLVISPFNSGSQSLKYTDATAPTIPTVRYAKKIIIVFTSTALKSTGRLFFECNNKNVTYLHVGQAQIIGTIIGCVEESTLNDHGYD